METSGPGGSRGPSGKHQSATLLAALEALRAELGEVADELITLLRAAGVTPEPASKGGPDGSKSS
ncbi:hypothetical protein [Thiobacter aerophilum]|uniref:Uncharacterized protein n=1 Tax=Thiobacter aerophilum TaxID=3121275 RepID=A0ABV0EGT6_9BURK